MPWIGAFYRRVLGAGTSPVRAVPFHAHRRRGARRGGRYQRRRRLEPQRGPARSQSGWRRPRFSDDDFDNRLPGELLDRAIFCEGCAAIHNASRGSNWTDLALSASAPDRDWPDDNGPQLPNNPVFVFDFTVNNGDIPPGAAIFFNMVFGDYDIFPAIILVEFASKPARRLEIELRRGLDGLIQARTALLRFGEVFTRDANGDLRGFAGGEFYAPAEPYTAFDFVELSLFQIAKNGRPIARLTASR